MDDQKKKIIAGAIIIALAAALTAFGFYFYAGKKKADSEKQETAQKKIEPTPIPKEIFNFTGTVKGKEGNILLVETFDVSGDFYDQETQPLVVKSIIIGKNTRVFKMGSSSDKKEVIEIKMTIGEFTEGDFVSIVASENTKNKKKLEASIVKLMPKASFSEEN